MVSLSTPVRDAGGNIVALLARTLHLSDLLSEYDAYKRGIAAGGAGVNRVIALFEGRTGTLLDHPHLDAGPGRTGPGAARPAVLLEEPERDALAAAPPGAGFTTAAHFDPVAAVDGGAAYAGPWLAAFFPVGGTDWVAAVQERRGAALAPVESLGRGLRRTGIAVALCVAALLAGLWAWLSRGSDAS